MLTVLATSLRLERDVRRERHDSNDELRRNDGEMAEKTEKRRRNVKEVQSESLFLTIHNQKFATCATEVLTIDVRRFFLPRCFCLAFQPIYDLVGHLRGL